MGEEVCWGASRVRLGDFGAGFGDLRILEEEFELFLSARVRRRRS